MSLTLGMDTGGTYTDGVIIDRSQNNAILCKAKSPTTRENLVIGIRNCIEALEFPRLKEVTMVALSTTLATNSVVEGKGGRVALLLMGKNDLEPPAEYVCRIKGRYDIMGNEKEPVDMNEIRQLAESLKGKVDAIAISGYASVSNPKHELTVAYPIFTSNPPLISASTFPSTGIAFLYAFSITDLSAFPPLIFVVKRISP